MKKPTRGEPFFYYFSIVLLLTVCLAFGLNILLRNYHLDAAGGDGVWEVMGK